ncbi:unnamed protein product [Paramecium sonneborni]|uniref:Uncharacterized protein n=1 Tax=Paramecium sonneborni TaxID=65129 RepID=A0A8S1RSV4_9CILI|nr:unnamed protein product [Paramecium sonneborni]
MGQVISQHYHYGGEYERISTITMKHNKRSVWIQREFNDGGLIQFKLSIVKCQYECDKCIENYQQFCFALIFIFLEIDHKF